MKENDLTFKEVVVDRQTRLVETEYGMIRLWYDLLISGQTEDGKDFFDIRIRAFKKGKSQEYVLDYEDQTLGITENPAYAKEVYELMLRELVMPESLLSVMDDLMYFH